MWVGMVLVRRCPRLKKYEHQITDPIHSAYTLTQCIFTLLFGKLYTLFHPKWTFLAALFVFEIGSLVCGVAPTSLALIIGVRVLSCEVQI